LNAVKAKMELQEQQIAHLSSALTASKLEREELELVKLKVTGEYMRVSAEFELREGKIQSLTGELNALKVVRD